MILRRHRHDHRLAAGLVPVDAGVPDNGDKFVGGIRRQVLEKLLVVRTSITEGGLCRGLNRLPLDSELHPMGGELVRPEPEHPPSRRIHLEKGIRPDKAGGFHISNRREAGLCNVGSATPVIHRLDTEDIGGTLGQGTDYDLCLRNPFRHQPAPGLLGRNGPTPTFAQEDIIKDLILWIRIFNRPPANLREKVHLGGPVLRRDAGGVNSGRK